MVPAPRSVVLAILSYRDVLRTGPLTIPGGVEGVGFIRTKFNAAHEDWPDVEIHFVSSSPAADGGSTIRRVMGMTDEVRADQQSVRTRVRGRGYAFEWGTRANKVFGSRLVNIVP